MKALSTIVVLVCCYSIHVAQISDIYRLDEPGLFKAGYELNFDSQGFLWVGTNKGLFKYEDYQSFKNMHPDTLYPKVVYSSIIDSLDRLWFIDLNDKINVCEDEKIKLFEPFRNHNVITHTLDQVNQILTIYSNRGIYNYHLLTNLIDTVAQFKSNLNSKIVPQGLHYADKIVYQINDFEDIEILPGYKIDSTLQNICNQQLPNFCELINISRLRIINVLHNSPYLFIIEDKENEFFIFNKATGELRLNKEISRIAKNTRIKSIQYKSNTIYIINTYGGSYLFDALTNDLKFIAESSGLTCANIQYYQNAIWISTSSNGVYSTKTNGIKFLDPFVSNNFTIDKGNDLLYVAENGSIKIFKGLELIDEIKVSQSQHIYNLTNLEGQILIHLSNQSVYRLEQKNLHLLKTKAKGHYTIKHKNKIFSAGYVGLSLQKNHSTINSYLLNNNKNSITIVNKRYRKFISNDDSDYIYLGGKFGLDKYNSLTNEMSELLSEISIKNLTQDSQDRIWVGTYGHGLWKIENDSITQIIDKNNYLYKKSANALLIDGTQLWVGTEKGLVNMNMENYESTKITKADGLLYDDVIGLAKTDSILYIFTSQGMFYQNINDVVENNFIPTCFLSNVKINQEDTMFQTHYNLTNNQNDISINFYSNDIHSYGENVLKYRLANKDTSWSVSNKNINTIHYQNLKHGTYKFEAFSSLPNEKQKSNIVSVSFKIDRPLYEKWWFRSTLILLIAFLIISFALFVLKRTNKILKLKNDLQLEKMKSLIQQMNPHFIYNTLNAIQYFIFKEKKIEATKYLANFSDLMRKNFQYSNCEFISLEKEIEHLKNYLKMEEVRFEDEVDIDLIIDDTLNARDLSIPPFFIQPFVENAFLYGLDQANSKGVIRIQFFGTKDFFKVSIEDEGRGMKASDETKKYSSIDNVKKRIELLNKLSDKNISLTISNLFPKHTKFKGNRIELKFPI